MDRSCLPLSICRIWNPSNRSHPISSTTTTTTLGGSTSCSTTRRRARPESGLRVHAPRTLLPRGTPPAQTSRAKGREHVVGDHTPVRHPVHHRAPLVPRDDTSGRHFEKYDAPPAQVGVHRRGIPAYRHTIHDGRGARSVLSGEAREHDARGGIARTSCGGDGGGDRSGMGGDEHPVLDGGNSVSDQSGMDEGCHRGSSARPTRHTVDGRRAPRWLGGWEEAGGWRRRHERIRQDGGGVSRGVVEEGCREWKRSGTGKDDRDEREAVGGVGGSVANNWVLRRR
mmetsp:Transcript_34237/g.82780  ORF Transcript_34237/g.82780 Transcript_34237/m.82780 type:complete len:283 (+) Transcript_34237:564-1412(+)